MMETEGVELTAIEHAALCAAVMPAPTTPHDSKFERLAEEHKKISPACLICGSTENCDVHHLFPWEMFPDKRYEPKFFRTLCRNPGCQGHLIAGHCGDWKAWSQHTDTDIVYLKARRHERKYEP